MNMQDPEQEQSQSTFERLTQEHRAFMDSLEQANEELRGHALQLLGAVEPKRRDSKVYRLLAQGAPEFSKDLTEEETSTLLDWALRERAIQMPSLREEVFTLVNLISRGLVYLEVDFNDRGLMVTALPMPDDLVNQQ